MFHIRRQKNTYRYSVAGWSRVHILALLCSEVYGNIGLCSYGSSSTRERGGLIGNSSTTTGTHDSSAVVWTSTCTSMITWVAYQTIHPYRVPLIPYLGGTFETIYFERDSNIHIHPVHRHHQKMVLIAPTVCGGCGSCGGWMVYFTKLLK